MREIQEAIALLGGAGAAAGAASGSFPRGRGLADLGFPAFEPRDLAAPLSSAGGLWEFGAPQRGGSYPIGCHRGAGGGAEPPHSPPLNLQGFLRGGSAGLGEHVGGNTPILEDFSYPLVNSPALLSGLGADGLDLSTRLNSLDGPGGERRYLSHFFFTLPSFLSKCLKSAALPHSHWDNAKSTTGLGQSRAGMESSSESKVPVPIHK